MFSCPLELLEKETLWKYWTGCSIGCSTLQAFNLCNGLLIYVVYVIHRDSSILCPHLHRLVKQGAKPLGRMLFVDFCHGSLSKAEVLGSCSAHPMGPETQQLDLLQGLPRSSRVVGALDNQSWQIGQWCSNCFACPATATLPWIAVPSIHGCIA